MENFENIVANNDSPLYLRKKFHNELTKGVKWLMGEYITPENKFWSIFPVEDEMTYSVLSNGSSFFAKIEATREKVTLTYRLYGQEAVIFAYRPSNLTFSVNDIFAVLEDLWDKAADDIERYEDTGVDMPAFQELVVVSPRFVSLPRIDTGDKVSLREKLSDHEEEDAFIENYEKDNGIRLSFFARYLLLTQLWG